VSEEQQSQGSAGSLALAVALYTVARLALVVVLAAIIWGIGKLAGVDVPILVAAVFGVLIALPLGMVVFKSLRLRVNEQIAAVDEQRRRRHDDLQTRLRGSGS
jgi:xanthine/uracil permease